MRRRAAYLLAAVLGVLLGLGAFTFYYAEGASYLSTDPQACLNCHIMQAHHDAWVKASHHAAATCVDCHLPASGLRKYWAKAWNGFRHSKAFTLQDFDEPIRISAYSATLLQENCLRCHEAFVHAQITEASGRTEPPQCVHCHRGVGHGDLVGLGGPRREDERRRSP